jgi:hypothetical protein
MEDIKIKHEWVKGISKKGMPYYRLDFYFIADGRDLQIRKSVFFRSLEVAVLNLDKYFKEN